MHVYACVCVYISKYVKEGNMWSHTPVRAKLLTLPLSCGRWPQRWHYHPILESRPFIPLSAVIPDLEPRIWTSLFVSHCLSLSTSWTQNQRGEIDTEPQVGVKFWMEGNLCQDALGNKAPSQSILFGKTQRLKGGSLTQIPHGNKV